MDRRVSGAQGATCVPLSAGTTDRFIGRTALPQGGLGYDPPGTPGRVGLPVASSARHRIGCPASIEHPRE
jgi:hypothetical protein